MSWFESPKERELRETRESWESVQRQWAGHELLKQGPFMVSFRLLSWLEKLLNGRLPCQPIFSPILDATVEFLESEELGSIDANWNAIESDVAAAVDFRRLVGRRRAWVNGSQDRMAAVQRYLLGTWKALIEAMPESCFGDPDRELDEMFDVPVVEVLDRPVELIQTCCVMPFADDYLRLEMFEQIRSQMRRNLLRASGLSVEANFAEVRSRIVWPVNARGKSPSELARSYLENTPFLKVLEAPAPFGVPAEARFEHGHVLGGTGAGKTQLLQRMIHNDLVRAAEDGRSVVVIDSQGDLIGKLLRLDLFAPGHRHSLADRLVLIDPSDIEYPPSLNLFDAHLERLGEYRPVDRERVLNGVVELYENMFGDMLGAELTQKQGVVFRYLARLMVTIPGATIHTLMSLMEDGQAFKPQMRKLDGSARHFFETEFFHPSFAATKKQIVRRLWGVLSTPAFERMFAQSRNKVDLFEATRDGKIILISTAKDLLKREGSSLMGRFFVNLIAQAALERSVLDPEDRTPTFVYVDEAHEYFDESVETILQQARKYRIGLVVAHQSLDQASPALRSALLANTSFKCVSGVSARDARVLADELRTEPEFIESMRRRENVTEFAAWVKHVTPRAIRLTVPLGYLERQETLSEETLDALLDANREKYCGRLGEIEYAFGNHAADEAEEETRPDQPESSVTETLPEERMIPPKPFERRVSGTKPSAPRERELGKGGQKHRYLQNLVKGLAEEKGFRAVVEAPLGGGQVDVLLTRGEEVVAVEVSVTTPVEWERQNLLKCLAATDGAVVLVLAKSDRTAKTYREAVVAGLAAVDRSRLTILYPEALPDFFASLTPTAGIEQRIVKGYKVNVSSASTSPEEIKARRDVLARLVSQSLARQDGGSE